MDKEKLIKCGSALHKHSALDKSIGADNTDNANKHATNNNTLAKDNSNPDLAKALMLLNDISNPDSDLNMGVYFANDNTTKQANHTKKDTSQSNPTDNTAKDNNTKNKDKDDNNNMDKDKDTNNNTNNSMKDDDNNSDNNSNEKTAPKKQDAVCTDHKGKEVAELATSSKVTTPPKHKRV